MGTFLQKTQAGSSNSSKNSVSASLSPYWHQLGYFYDLGTRFKGGQRLPFHTMNYRSIADSKQLLTSFHFHRWITKACEKHSYITLQPQSHFFCEPMICYRNLSISNNSSCRGVPWAKSACYCMLYIIKHCRPKQYLWILIWRFQSWLPNHQILFPVIFSGYTVNYYMCDLKHVLHDSKYHSLH